MSFSSEVKDTIIKSPYKSSCCRRALLQGVILSKGYIPNENEININIEKEEHIAFIKSFIKEFFGKDATVTSLPKGGRSKRVFFESKALSRYLNESESQDAYFSEKCPGCLSAFLRGVFFACGRVSDPNKQFCLEFSVGNRLSVLSSVFENYGFDFKSTVRKNETIIYTKNSSVIEDFFAALELNDVIYTFMNIKIANEFMNNANRIRNFDTVNISKTVEAANPQYTVIKKLYENNLINSLPDELIQTAKLRFENPDMSHAQLAMHSVPPISKSGITHRMEKIMKIGKELISKYNL